jgi:putative hemolysin
MKGSVCVLEDGQYTGMLSSCEEEVLVRNSCRRLLT